MVAVKPSRKPGRPSISQVNGMVAVRKAGVRVAAAVVAS
jgi:hypothetical protein